MLSFIFYQLITFRDWTHPPASEAEKSTFADMFIATVKKVCKQRLQGPVIMDVTEHVDCSRRIAKALLGHGVPGAERWATFDKYSLADFPAEYFPAAWSEYVAGCVIFFVSALINVRTGDAVKLREPIYLKFFVRNGPGSAIYSDGEYAVRYTQIAVSVSIVMFKSQRA
jgi:hypothetical protein